MTWAQRGVVIGAQVLVRSHHLVASVLGHGRQAKQAKHWGHRVRIDLKQGPQSAQAQASTATGSTGGAGGQGQEAGAQVTSLYELLGVGRTASVAEIKAAYRQLARLHHPDVNTEPTALLQFQVISQAYEVLSSKELRKQYNTQGLSSLNIKDFKELLKFFGQDEEAGQVSYMGNPPLRGEDVFTVVGLPLDEAVTGAQKVVTINVRKSCPSCEGRGVVHSSASTPACPVCRGRRRLLRTVRRPDVAVHFVKLGDCPACAGKGVRPAPPCGACAGDGRGRAARLGVQVDVPAGVSDGNVIRIKSLGHTGRYGGQAGDLYIKLQVHPCANLERRGQDLHSSLDLGLYDALLGGPLEVATPRGGKLLAVPQGTQAGDVLCLERAGVAVALQGVTSWGHHFFTVRVVVPDGGAMGAAEVELLHGLAKLGDNRMNQWW